MTRGRRLVERTFPVTQEQTAEVCRVLGLDPNRTTEIDLHPQFARVQERVDVVTDEGDAQ